MPNEIKQYPGSSKSPLRACFKNVVHDPEGSHYKNVETRGGKRSMVDLGER